MKRKTATIAAIIGLVVTIAFMIWLMKKDIIMSPVAAPDQSTQVNPDVTLSKVPEESVTMMENAKDNVCENLKDHYQNLADLKKTQKTSVRFVNIHKKIDGIVYRLRFFYKDTNEGKELPTYLLYREDQNEDEHIIENTRYKKGPNYLKMEKAHGEIIYTEEGINLGVDQDLFLHFENNKLKDLQGVNPIVENKVYIECRF